MPGNVIKKKTLGGSIRERWQLYLLVFIPFAFLVIFDYLPLGGLALAFKKYSPGLSIAEAPWVGMANFAKFFQSYKFTTILKNTLTLSFYMLLTFPIPIIFALMLNAMLGRWYKKLIQTVTYLPYFISTVIIVGILLQILDERIGLYGNMYMLLTGNAAPSILANGHSFRHLYVWSYVWQTCGYNAVIYIAALTNVDPNLHEAAKIDGASRLQRVLHIDLPSILPTINIMFILAIGGIMGVGAEKALLMQNTLNLQYSEIISTYEYKVGLSGLTGTDFSLSTAIGMFNSLVNFTLLLIANRVSKKLGGSGIL